MTSSSFLQPVASPQYSRFDTGGGGTNENNWTMHETSDIGSVTTTATPNRIIVCGEFIQGLGNTIYEQQDAEESKSALDFEEK